MTAPRLRWVVTPSESNCISIPVGGVPPYTTGGTNTQQESPCKEVGAGHFGYNLAVAHRALYDRCQWNGVARRISCLDVEPNNNGSCEREEVSEMANTSHYRAHVILKSLSLSWEAANEPSSTDGKLPGEIVVDHERAQCDGCIHNADTSGAQVINRPVLGQESVNRRAAS